MDVHPTKNSINRYWSDPYPNEQINVWVNGQQQVAIILAFTMSVGFPGFDPFPALDLPGFQTVQELLKDKPTGNLHSSCRFSMIPLQTFHWYWGSCTGSFYVLTMSASACCFELALLLASGKQPFSGCLSCRRMERTGSGSFPFQSDFFKPYPQLTKTLPNRSKQVVGRLLSTKITKKSLLLGSMLCFYWRVMGFEVPTVRCDDLG